jgi:hypothetical protein
MIFHTDPPALSLNVLRSLYACHDGLGRFVTAISTLEPERCYLPIDLEEYPTRNLTPIQLDDETWMLAAILRNFKCGKYQDRQPIDRVITWCLDAGLVSRRELRIGWSHWDDVRHLMLARPEFHAGFRGMIAQVYGEAWRSGQVHRLLANRDLKFL